jgi:hypothetical protein
MDLLSPAIDPAPAKFGHGEFSRSEMGLGRSIRLRVVSTGALRFKQKLRPGRRQHGGRFPPSGGFADWKRILDKSGVLESRL